MTTEPLAQEKSFHSEQGRRNISEKNEKTRIFVPDGLLLSEYIRRGFEMEKAGIPVPEIAKYLKIGHFNYRSARTVIKLSDAENLNSADREIVKQAIQMLDKTKRAYPARGMVDVIVKKFWGKSRTHNTKRAKERVKTFQNGIKLIAETCIQAAELEIPAMNQDEFNKAEAYIRTTRRALRKLSSRLKMEKK